MHHLLGHSYNLHTGFENQLEVVSAYNPPGCENFDLSPPQKNLRLFFRSLELQSTSL